MGSEGETTVGHSSTTKSMHELRANHELTNPCFKEYNLTLKCLDDNNYEKSACEDYFANYRNCKKFWGKITFQRRWRGIKPYLPLPEDRERIKEEYMNSQRT